MKSEIIGGVVGTSLSAVGTGLQTNEVLQTISLVITIIGGLITFIIVPLVSWYKEAKKDGKIDKDEIKQATDIVITGGEQISESVKRDKNK